VIRTRYWVQYDGDRKFYVVRSRWFREEATVTLWWDGYLRMVDGKLRGVADYFYLQPSGTPDESRKIDEDSALYKAVDKARLRHTENLAKLEAAQDRARDEARWTPIVPPMPTAIAFAKPSGTLATLLQMFRSLYLPRPRRLPELPFAEVDPDYQKER